MASFKGKGTFRQNIEPFKDWFTKVERKKLCLLGVILKLSQSLNITERNIDHDLKITPHKDCWVMAIQAQNYYAPEQYQLEKQKSILKNYWK
ncbi:hypothetical protein QNH39_12565 [Neobacillus novalis]|uniref:Uncharacterized protein n=1 Tax=Neobacillus novalis TaxID=220687 RepID=A0AA95MV60_9BACI|nr:hypothetical protein [Neobacillus novalis]WHY88615.1 hypothetical protein QNH39_12565 [Neobacillus novalis]